jgi:hypothetical protein
MTRRGGPAIDDRADHRGHQAIERQFGRWPGADAAAVAEDADPIGDPGDLVEMMRDINDRQATGLQLAEDREQTGRLGAIQGGGRLVEDKDASRSAEGAGDLNKLALAGRQGIGPRAGIDGETELLEVFGGPAPQGAAIEPGAYVGLVAESEVLGDAQRADKAQFLVDHRHATFEGVGRAPEADALAVEKNLAAIGPDRAAEDAHQGALAGAVLAAEGVDLAPPAIEIDAAEGADAGVFLADPEKLDAGRVVGRLGWGQRGGPQTGRRFPCSF